MRGIIEFLIFACEKVLSNRLFVMELSDILNSNYASFPQKLYAIIELEKDILCWTKKGLSFKINDTEKFANTIIPKYFRHTKMTSFQRQLNLYGFRRITKGDDSGAYFHPKFQQNKMELLCEIKRQPISGKHNQTTEGDFSSPALKRTRKVGNVKLPDDSYSNNLNKVNILKIQSDKVDFSDNDSINGNNSVEDHDIVNSVDGETASDTLDDHDISMKDTVDSQSKCETNKELHDDQHEIVAKQQLSRPRIVSPPPLLHRNFSVSSAVDSDWVLPPDMHKRHIDGNNDQDEPFSNRVKKSNSLADMSSLIYIEKPLLAHNESESWIHLSALPALDILNEPDDQEALLFIGGQEINQESPEK